MESMFVLIFYIAMRIYSMIMFLLAGVMLLFQIFLFGVMLPAIANASRGNGGQIANLLNRH